MRVRFYPKTEAVRNVLIERLDRAVANLAEDAEAHKRAKEAWVQVPSELAGLQLMVDADVQGIEDLKSQLSLLESHGPPEVMCEIDL